MNRYIFMLYILMVFITVNVQSQIISGSAFLKGTYLELGMGPCGTYGTSLAPPAGFHPRGPGLGFVADVGKDGWGVGSPNFCGDYFTPGSPEEGFGLQINGVNYNNNQLCGQNQIAGSIIDYRISGTDILTTWQGGVSGVQLISTTRLPINDVFFITEITLKNTTSATLNNIYYMRNVDPDQEVTMTGNYSTNNFVVAQNPNTSSRALVSATGLAFGCYLGMGTKDCRARVTWGGFANRNPSDVWNETGGLSQSGFQNNADIAISIAFKIPTLAPGESATFKFAHVLSAADLDRALELTVPGLSVNGISAANNSTIDVCANVPIPIQIINGSGYSWTWSPSVGLNTSIGNIVEATIESATTYVATGTNSCGSTSTLTVTLNPSLTETIGILGAITGETSICLPTSSKVYSVNPIPNASVYEWNVPSGVSIISGDGTNAITVSFSSDFSGNVTVKARNGCNVSNISFLSITGSTAITPTINCPDNIIVNSDPDKCGKLVTYSATGNGVITYAIPSGSPFPVGTTLVNATSTTACGSTSCSFSVTVVDNTLPTFTCPAPQNINLNATCQLLVPDLIAELTGNDNCGTVTFTQNPVAGSALSSSHNQNHNVVVTADDGNGNTTQCTVVLTGKDVLKPTVTPPASVDLECSGDLPAGATTITEFLALAGASATDNCTEQSSLTVSSVDGALVGSNCSGTVTRTYTITDAAGNAKTIDQVFTVTDNTIPVINTCPGSGNTFTRNSNNGLCTYKISGIAFDATGSDNCSAVTMSYSITNEHNSTTVTGTESLAGVELNFGLNTITWIATDACSNPSASCTVTVDVDKITTATTLTVAPASRQYSDKVTLTATVTPYNCTGAGDIGGIVTFKIGTFVLGTANVVNGIATLTTALLEDQLYDANLNDPMNATNGPLKPGDKVVTAHFSGTDPDYIVINPTAALTVTCEDGDITYNGQTYFTVSPNTNSGTVVLSNYVVDRNDTPTGARGDIRNATATFWNNSLNGSVLGTANIPVGLVNLDNKQEGFVSTSFNDALSNTDIINGGKVYEVWSGLNNYYCGNSDTYTPVTLGLPGQDFVTGGGYIVIGNNSAGTYAGTSGKRMNFGFVMRWNSSGKNLQGRVNVVYRKMVTGVQRIYQIKSNAITSLVVENVNDAGTPATGTNIKFRRATISTKANLTDITDPLNPVSLGGNLSLTLIAWESTTVTTGTLDRISIQLSGSGSVGLLFASNWSSGKTVQQTLNGGKIQVRNPASAAPGQRNTSDEIITIAEQPVFMVKALPNPSSNYFNLIVEGNNKDAVHLTIYNVNGTLLYQEKGMANRNYTFGNSWFSGVYLLHVKQGKELKTIKLVKL